MKIILAPMEGVVDPVLRELITNVGGVDYCVTEFIRVTDRLNPDKVFYRYCPELHTNSRTASGTPVFVQLLGGKPEPIAENAHKVAELGAYGVDLNFGCPAKTVNRHDGGATLLKNPERLHHIIEKVRAAVPKDIPVTAKVRLGFNDKSYVTEIAQASETGGATWLTVHARTKEEAYRPPAHWEYIAQMKEAVSIPVIANGDIWNPEDHLRCREISGCQDTMLGRGLVARPDLARQIKTQEELSPWLAWKNYLKDFMAQSLDYRNEVYAVQRMKQLTKLMGRTYPESLQLFDNIKRLKSFPEIVAVVENAFETKPHDDHNSKVDSPNSLSPNPTLSHCKNKHGLSPYDNPSRERVYPSASSPS